MPDPGPTPPPLPHPPIHGEISPSPPPSPSPFMATRSKTKTSASRINNMLDASTMGPGTPPPQTNPNVSITPTAATAPPHANQAITNNQYTPTAIVQAKPSDSSLPGLDQIMDAANLRPQRRSKRPLHQDPLEKYSKGITTPIHDAFPEATYEFVSPKTITEWTGLEGEKLLAIPFGNEGRSPNANAEISNLIFDAVSEITGSSKLGVSAPTPNDEGTQRKKMPITFLIYKLSEVHRQILLQQTVWASSSITFRITTTPVNCPSYLFAISNLRSKDKDQVRDTIRHMWNDEITSAFIQENTQSLSQEEKSNTIQTIQAFMDSIRVTKLDKLLKGGTPKTMFNVYTNGDIINDTKSWKAIRKHLAERSYRCAHMGIGVIEVTPHHCGLCHGADHPQGMCPFPSIEGWKGPKRKSFHQDQKKGTMSRNVTKTFLDGWN